MIEIELIDREHDVDGGEHAEEQQLADEGVPVAVLQRVVEAVVPLVDQHVDADERQLDRDHGGEQDASRPAVLGTEIGNGEPPDGGERRDEACHGRSPVVDFSGEMSPQMVGLGGFSLGQRRSHSLMQECLANAAPVAQQRQFYSFVSALSR